MSKTKSKKTVKRKLAWKRIFAIFFPLFLGAVFIFNYANGGSVLGISEKSAEKSAKSEVNGCKKNRVSAFSATGVCDSNKNGFKEASYTCEDGTTGTISYTCFPIQAAYEKAQKACSKKSTCIRPTKSPKPSESIPEPTSGL